MGYTERDVMLAWNEVWKKLVEWSYEELVAACEAISERFAVMDTEWEALEVRRRVAEGIFDIAQAKQRPVEECERLLNSVQALGWSDLYAKTMTLYPFCRYCLDHGRKDLGLRHLAPLVEEVEAERERPGEPWCKNMIGSLRQLLAELQVA